MKPPLSIKVCADGRHILTYWDGKREVTAVHPNITVDCGRISGSKRGGPTSRETVPLQKLINHWNGAMK